MDHLSTEYVLIPISADGDPTSYPVRMTFLAVEAGPLPEEPRPVESDWKSASWTSIQGVPHARLLVGPDGGAITLAPGIWRPWIDIDAGTEHPVVPAPRIEIT